MNDKWQSRFACEAYNEFILRLLASQARNAGPCDRDPPIPRLYTVACEEMLDRFLTKNTDLSAFRAELGRMYSDVSHFCVNKTLWDREQLSAKEEMTAM